MKKQVLVKLGLILLLISHSALASIYDLGLVVKCKFASGKTYVLNHTSIKIGPTI